MSECRCPACGEELTPFSVVMFPKQDRKPYYPEWCEFCMTEKPAKKCPICGEEAETVYMANNVVVGCDNCITRRNAVDFWEALTND